MSKTVMIVEDNELNMKLFHDLLEAHGYRTVGTRNGIEALDLARKHRPDLILADLHLPDIGGDTMWANMVEAHTRLPEEIQANPRVQEVYLKT